MFDEKIEKLRTLIEKQQKERFTKEGYNYNGWEKSCKATVKPGKKYIKIDVGTSGKFMIDMEGNIFGIKGYGVIHRGHRYGTLDTIDKWYWGDYTIYPLRRLGV